MMIDIDILLTWGATYKQVDAGEIIFEEGGICRFYHQVVDGRVKWYNLNNEGKEYLQMIIEPGECFGELPLFDGETYVASAMALVPTTIIRLHESTFHQLLREQPDLHIKFSTLLAQRLRYKFYLQKELATQDPEHKIQSLLQCLRNNKKNMCCQCNQIKLTRQQIADMTGLRVETVIRCMRNMHDRGELFIERGKVYFEEPMRGIINGSCKA